MDSIDRLTALALLTATARAVLNDLQAGIVARLLADGRAAAGTAPAA